jgi:hypothetical protein
MFLSLSAIFLLHFCSDSVGYFCSSCYIYVQGSFVRGQTFNALLYVKDVYIISRFPINITINIVF